MGPRIFRLWAILVLVLCLSAMASARTKGVDSALLAKANAGDVEAQHDLGNMYYFGSEVRRDYAQAALWYRKAAEQGDPDSQFRIGGFYHFGFGVPKDDAQAFVWMKKAAEQQHADAENFLAVFYDEGFGVPKDEAHGYFWLRRAAEDGNAQAQYFLGWAYENGLHGVYQDYVEAYFWLDLAATESDSRKERKEASTKRNVAASHLTQAELVSEQERVREWQKRHPAKAR
jgi:TPR repeat protein